MACRIHEAEIRAEQNLLHKKDKLNQPQHTSFSHQNEETILPTELNLYPTQETLESEDLEIHHVMLESYWVQPSPLGNTSLPHMRSDDINSPKGNNDPLNHTCNTFGNSTYVHIEFPEEDANLNYLTHLAVEKGRTDHPSK